MWGGGEGLLCLAVRLFLLRLFLFRLFSALFLGSLFSLLFLFLFSFFLSPFSFSFFLSLFPSLFSVPFLLGPSAFCVKFRISCSTAPHCSALALGRALMARFSRAKQPRPGGAGCADARRAWRPALRRAARTVLLCPLRVGPAVGAATSPHPISRRAARILGAGRAIETMWMVAPCMGKRNADLFNKTPGGPPRRRRSAAQDVLKMAWRVDAGRGESRPKRTGPRLAQGDGRRRAGARGGKGKRAREKEKEERGKKEKRVEKERNGKGKACETC